MKTILISFLLLLIIAANHFEVIQAHSEAWTGGAKNSGSGTEYYFKTVISANEHIKFDSLWIDNEAMPLMAIKGKKYDAKAVIAKNDTVLLRASHKNNPKATAIVKPPVAYTGAALIGYTVNGKKHYYTVKKIEKRQAHLHQ